MNLVEQHREPATELTMFVARIQEIFTEHELVPYVRTLRPAIREKLLLVGLIRLTMIPAKYKQRI